MYLYMLCMYEAFISNSYDINRIGINNLIFIPIFFFRTHSNKFNLTLSIALKSVFQAEIFINCISRQSNNIEPILCHIQPSSIFSYRILSFSEYFFRNQMKRILLFSLSMKGYKNILHNKFILL